MVAEEADDCQSDNDVVVAGGCGGATQSCMCCYWGGERREVVEVHRCSPQTSRRQNVDDCDVVDEGSCNRCCCCSCVCLCCLCGRHIADWHTKNTGPDCHFDGGDDTLAFCDPLSLSSLFSPPVTEIDYRFCPYGDTLCFCSDCDCDCNCDDRRRRHHRDSDEWYWMRICHCVFLSASIDCCLDCDSVDCCEKSPCCAIEKVYGWMSRVWCLLCLVCA